MFSQKPPNLLFIFNAADESYNCMLPMHVLIFSFLYIAKIWNSSNTILWQYVADLWLKTSNSKNSPYPYLLVRAHNIRAPSPSNIRFLIVIWPGISCHFCYSVPASKAHRRTFASLNILLFIRPWLHWWQTGRWTSTAWQQLQGHTPRLWPEITSLNLD